MNRGDVARLLAVCAAYDQRTAGEADVLAWAELIGDLNAADAVQAVKNHYATETRRVMPVDVITGVRRIRDDRLARNPLPDPPADMTAIEYRDWLRHTTKLIADGELTTSAAATEVNPAGQERLRVLAAGIGREVPVQ